MNEGLTSDCRMAIPGICCYGAKQLWFGEEGYMEKLSECGLIQPYTTVRLNY